MYIVFVACLKGYRYDYVFSVVHFVFSGFTSFWWYNDYVGINKYNTTNY